MENLRGITLMTLGMAGFAVADAAIKELSGHMPVGQVLFLFGLGGTLVYLAIARARGLRFHLADLRRPIMVFRNAVEALATYAFITALSLIPISTASAILQAAPLAVTLGAAVILRERVGWRRWSAILTGFAGVMIVVRPGGAGFEIGTLLAVIGTLGLAARDLCVRMMPRDIPNLVVTTYGFAMIALTGLAMTLIGGSPVPIGPDSVGLLFLSILMGTLSYSAVTAALRSGDVSAMAPFRYSRILFAFAIGYAWFGETLDAPTIFGAGLIVGSGLYTLNRERKRRNAEYSPSS